MTPATSAQCLSRLESAITAADYDYEHLTAAGDHLRAEQKRIEGVMLRRAHRRFTESRATLRGLDMAAGAAPTRPDGRYRISIRQLFGLEVG